MAYTGVEGVGPVDKLGQAQEPVVCDQIGDWEGGKIWELSCALRYLWQKVPGIHQDRAPSKVPTMLPEGKSLESGHHKSGNSLEPET